MQICIKYALVDNENDSQIDHIMIGMLIACNAVSQSMAVCSYILCGSYDLGSLPTDTSQRSKALNAASEL